MGDEIGVGNANCDGCRSKWDDQQTAPVGSFTANAFGLYDMHGNVWEHVQDCYHPTYDGAPDDGSARVAGVNCTTHVVRGGSWLNYAWDLRAANRYQYSTRRQNNLGLRLARDIGF